MVRTHFLIETLLVKVVDPETEVLEVFFSVVPRMRREDYIPRRVGREICTLDQETSQDCKVQKREDFKVTDDISSKRGNKPNVKPFKVRFIEEEDHIKGRVLSTNLHLVHPNRLFRVNY